MFVRAISNDINIPLEKLIEPDRYTVKACSNDNSTTKTRTLYQKSQTSGRKHIGGKYLFLPKMRAQMQIYLF